MISEDDDGFYLQRDAGRLGPFDADELRARAAEWDAQDLIFHRGDPPCTLERWLERERLREEQQRALQRERLWREQLALERARQEQEELEERIAQRLRREFGTTWGRELPATSAPAEVFGPGEVSDRDFFKGQPTDRDPPASERPPHDQGAQKPDPVEVAQAGEDWTGGNRPQPQIQPQIRPQIGPQIGPQTVQQANPTRHAEILCWEGHPALRGRPVWLGVMFASFLPAGAALGWGLPLDPLFWVAAALLGTLAGLLWIFWGRAQRFRVTTERIQARSGRHLGSTSELALTDIRSIDCQRRGPSRWLGVGTLIFRSGPDGGRVEFRQISRPGRVQKLVRKLQAKAGPAPFLPPAAADRDRAAPQRLVFRD